MKVILQEDVKNLGQACDVVEVADGFGRNFLLPRKLAVLADEGSMNRVEHLRRITQARQARVLAEAKELAARLSTIAVSIKRKATSETQIFGSVTNQDIAEALAAEGIVVDRRNIMLAEPIRTISVTQVAIKVHSGVEASIKVYVRQA